MLMRLAKRNQSGTAMRRAVGLFAIVWLNLALTPCAVAFDSAHECPHSKPAGQHEMAGHHAHGESTPEHTCVSLQESCCELADVSVDSRSGPAKLDTPDAEGMAATWPETSFDLVPSRYLVAADPPDPPGAAAALHKLFCVYLN